MIKTAAFQMDPMETLSIGGDSSFALMLAAQTRGHCAVALRGDRPNMG